ncbi:Homeobox protein Hox-C6 [Cyphomyrmex costatus]|uniref:Homeobox protein Hox-C6 n=2 Tax=Cyphomyrmex costatus TaxID=456900 RepID=A0A195CQQ2_9HYME|nr:Homeobox protein Hox-C6 [Cyphomyrmex costatus]
MNLNNGRYYCPINIPSHQPYYQQALMQGNGPERHVLSHTSLLRDTLVHGKKTVTQNYAYSYTNVDGMISSYQITPNNQMVPYNSCQVSSAKYPSSEISPTECEEFLNNIEGKSQQQEYNKCEKSYPEHNYVQSHNYTLCTPGPSTISMQYEQDKSKQQLINVQQGLQIDSYNRNNNNNNIRQRNKNIRTSNHNRQRSPYSNEVANYPWMFRRTNAHQENGTEQKRTRQTYSRSQIFELEKEYRLHKYLAKKQRLILAKYICLTERQVKIWFQNRRMKEKKSPNTSVNIAVSTSSESTVSSESSTQMIIHENQGLNPTQQTQLQSSQPFYNEGHQNYFHNQNIFSTNHYLNNAHY